MKHWLPILVSILIVVLVIGLVFSYAPKQVSEPLPTSTPNSSASPTNSPSTISQGPVPAIPFQLPSGFSIHTFATSIPNARDLQFSPGGTLLVSSPQTNQVVALPDKNNDGMTDTNKVVISQGNHIHGLAFYNGKLYVAEVTRVVRYNWDEEKLEATLDKVLFSLPSNNNHNNRTLTFDTAGNLYISLGSSCNVCREAPEKGGSVLISNAEGKTPTVFASGLRNAPFTTMHPKTQELWGTEMGRDYLGDSTPPDEINIIKQSANYGWPNCYGDKIHDTTFDTQASNPCTTTVTPTYQIPAHSAPLGLTFIASPQFPADWQGDILVSYHGSWNRSTPIGYKVVRLKVQGNTIVSSEDFLTGFLQGATAGSSQGRPVDVTFDSTGNLYVSDDKAGGVYIIQKTDL